VSLFAAASGAFAALAASAKQHPQPLTCNEHPVTARVNTNHSSQRGGWGSGKIVSGGSGVGSPISISGQVLDTTLMPNQIVFSFNSKKGSGKAEHNQQTVTCTQMTTGKVSDFVPPGAQLPPGAALTDNATFTLTVIVVPKGHTTLG
jgi:hypothetical protein